MIPPDWQLPAGVSRSLWEFAHDPRIARDEERHLAGSPLLEFDRQVIARWFPGAGTVVDLGCGTGRLLVDFVSRGWGGIGIDLSPESLRVAQERARAAGARVALARGNLCSLDFLADEMFDAALLMFGTLGMISGADNRLAVLRHARRLLRPTGGLALHVHSVWRHLFFPEGRQWLLGDLWRRLALSSAAGDTAHDYRGIPNMYHHAFTFGELRSLLKRAGFEIVETIALDPGLSAAADRASRRPGAQLRATGWLVLARRT